jgi:adenine-specific DNA-methyltransferase
LELNNIDNGNRNFILCEQLDYIESVTKSRIEKVIQNNNQGDFIFFQLKEQNQVFVDLLSSAKTNDELVKIWQEMVENSFLNWYVNPEMPEDAIHEFNEIGKEENGLVKQKKLLMELLDKNQLYVNLSEIDDAKFNVSDEDKALNRAFYGEN